MDGAAPAAMNFIAVAYVIALCAVVAAFIGVIQLFRGGTLWPAFGVLVAPWLMVLTDPRIIPVYAVFAVSWGNPVLPVWMTPLVGSLLVVAAALRALRRWHLGDEDRGRHTE